ncbi:MAG: TonB-dependent receptor, partial [Calditrichota bacterium]
MFKYLFLFTLALIALPLYSAQSAEISGNIRDTDNNPIAGVNIQVKDTNLGASTDKDGHFRIMGVPPGNHTLAVSYLGYVSQTQTIIVPKEGVSGVSFNLALDRIALSEIEVKIKREKSQIKIDAPVRVEVITSKDLAKASSDGSLLSSLGSRTGLNTRPCALCGSAGVGMQGLDPSYTAVNVNGLPVISGLGSLYGLSSVAVADVSSVELTKGSQSSESGAGAIAGTINVNMREPEKKSTLNLQLSGGETLQHSLSGEWQHSVGGTPFKVSLNYAAEPRLIDRNSDRLTDTPQFRRLGLNLAARRSNLKGQINATTRLYRERRFAGDVRWTESDRGSALVYGREIFTDRQEMTLNYQRTPQSWGTWSIESAYIHHTQNSWYGTTEYDATQSRFFSRFSVNWQVNSFNSILGQGFYTYDVYDDNLSLNTPTDRTDRVPGVMVQHTWKPSDRWSTQFGVRGEGYSGEGLVPTIRGGAKLKLNSEWTLLASSGTGYRPVTIFSLDRAVHAGFDNVQVPQTLKPERSLNNTLTVNYKTATAKNAVQIDMTAFYTSFTNKVVLAYGDHAGMTRYSNADDAYSRGLELQTTWSNIQGWTLDVGGSVNDVQFKDELGWRLDEMRNYWTASLTLLKKWTQPALAADVNARIYGPQKLPAGRSRSESPRYVIIDAGLSKQFKNLTLAFSISNLTDWV